MSNLTPFYRKYVRGVVSKANSQKAALQRDIVYMQLVKWLRNQNTRLEKEMFNAVLNSSKNLQKTICHLERRILNPLVRKVSSPTPSLPPTELILM